MIQNIEKIKRKKEVYAMFWRILKKDLKRKKAMNIILLLFVILCSMFAAAAVNNITAVTGGIEHYFDVADVPDVTVLTLGENDAGERIAELACVSEIKTEHWLSCSSKSFRHNGKKLDNFTNAACLISDREMAVFNVAILFLASYVTTTDFTSTPDNVPILPNESLPSSSGDAASVGREVGFFA